MSQETTNAAGLPTSGYVVTHYLRPGDTALNWQTFGSAELSAVDAIALIQQREADAADLGFSPVAPAAPVDPPTAALPEPATESAPSGAADSSAAPQLGNS